MCLRTRRESGDFLVPDMHPFDLVLAANGIGDAVEAVADNAVDALDARCSQDLRELISNGLCHLGLPRGERDDSGAPCTMRWRGCAVADRRLEYPFALWRAPLAHKLGVPSLGSSAELIYC